MSAYDFSAAQRRADGLPRDFAKREPRIEVYVRCERCDGDFFNFERRGGDLVDAAPGTNVNCYACSYGVQRAIVPLEAAIDALDFGRKRRVFGG